MLRSTAPCLLLPLLAAALCLGSSPAARAQSLEPMNRVHLGASLIPGPAPFGVTGGFDSRLTRMIFVDAGGFGTLGSPSAEDMDPDHGSIEALKLRHGIYLAPGLRIPHVQPKSFSIDLLPRGGMAAIWLADLDRDLSGHSARYANEVAGFAGADLFVQRGRAGLRFSWRQLIYAPYAADQKADVLTSVPLLTLEAQVQLGGTTAR